MSLQDLIGQVRANVVLIYPVWGLYVGLPVWSPQEHALIYNPVCDLGGLEETHSNEPSL